MKSFSRVRMLVGVLLVAVTVFGIANFAVRGNIFGNQSLLTAGILDIFRGPKCVPGTIVWKETRPAGNEDKDWTAASSSYNGRHLIVAANTNITAPATAHLYLSSNSGKTWTETRPAGGTTGYNWVTTSSSSDGSHLIAGGTNNRLYLSSDFGKTWTETRPAGTIDYNWLATSSSSDGSHLVAVAGGFTGIGYIYLSSDYGVTWTETRPAGSGNHIWGKVSSSSNGSHLVAGEQNGRLYTSSDYGVTWNETRPAGNVNRNWGTISSSSDGSHLVAGNSTDIYLYLSSDFGETWTKTNPSGTSNYGWTVASSNSDGSHLVVAERGRRLYFSSNFGTTWSEARPAGNVDKKWNTTSFNADGTRLIVGVFSGRLYIRSSCISKPSITVTYPTAKSTLIQGETYDITWKSTGVEKVSIQLVHGTNGYDIAVAIPASPGKYTWKVPTYPGPNTNYKINIFTWPDSNTVFSSSGLFTIVTRGGGGGATGFVGGGN